MTAADDRAARNKTRNAAQKVKGQVKEAAGRVTGDRRLEAEGRADKRGANLRQAGVRAGPGSAAARLSSCASSAGTGR
jgi:uncharacterized protein YjbJ (UPF0337 family)